VSGFAAQECQHGLVAAVHTIEVADGHGAGRGQIWVVKTAKNLHVLAPMCVLDLGLWALVMILRNSKRIL
jgi:hypothetical protein